jgi:hypothetical protein
MSKDVHQVSPLLQPSWMPSAAGHQKELLTFSNATSANDQQFMERPYILD